MQAVGLDDLLGKWPERIVPLGKGEARLDAAAAADLGPECGDARGPGRDRRLPRHARPGGDRRRRRRGDRRVEHLPPGPVERRASSARARPAAIPTRPSRALYTIEAGQTATGSILDWYRRHFAGKEQAEAERRGVNVYQVLDEQAAAVPPGAEGLVVRDDWQGNRSPYKNPAGPRGDRRAVAGPRPRPRLPRPLRGDGLRHPAHPRRRRRARPARSSGSSSAAAGRGRRSGSRSTPISSSGRST